MTPLLFIRAFRYAYTAILLSALAEPFLRTEISFVHFYFLLFVALLVTDGFARERAFENMAGDGSSATLLYWLLVFGLEIIGFMFISSWAYAMVDAQDPSNSRLIWLSLFFLLNFVSAVFQVIAFRRANITERRLSTIISTAIFADLYELSMGEKVFFVTGAKALDNGFVRSLKLEQSDSVIQGIPRWRAIYCINRSVIKAAIQYFGMHIFVFNLMFAGLSLVIYFELADDLLSVFHSTILYSLRFTVLLVLAALIVGFYVWTTQYEINRQEVVGDALSFRADLPPGRAELWTQFLGNVSVIGFISLLLLVVLDASASAAVVMVILLSFLVSFGMVYLGSRVDRVEPKKMVRKRT